MPENASAIPAYDKGGDKLTGTDNYFFPCPLFGGELNGYPVGAVFSREWFRYHSRLKTVPTVITLNFLPRKNFQKFIRVTFWQLQKQLNLRGKIFANNCS